ncbi:hypothetical protein DNTS_008786, partial [Danionella cerebrum]
VMNAKRLTLLRNNMNTNDIVYYASQIEKLSKNGNYEDITPLLKDLNKINVARLKHVQTTAIIKVLYKLIQSCHVETIRSTGKRLLSKWKKLYSCQNKMNKETTVDNEQGTLKFCDFEEPLENPVPHGGPQNNTDNNELTSNAHQHKLTKESNHLPSEKHSIAETTGFAHLHDKKGDFAAPHQSATEENCQTSVHQITPESVCSSRSNELRSKCVHLILEALSPNHPMDSEEMKKFKTLAQDIETHVHAINGRNQLKYKSCIRSKVSNLKNPKNPRLRQDLVSGTLTPLSFARMSVAEMAGAELRKLRESYTTLGITEHQLPAGVEGTATRKVRCRNCDAMDCRVTQVSRGMLFLPSWVQSGSTDNDSMTFMTCAKCGEQWYHSSWAQPRAPCLGEQKRSARVVL